MVVSRERPLMADRPQFRASSKKCDPYSIRACPRNLSLPNISVVSLVLPSRAIGRGTSCYTGGLDPIVLSRVSVLMSQRHVSTFTEIPRQFNKLLYSNFSLSIS
eukprot:scaffold20461_cov117-Cylindrotheca_fusiformis.AAC.14